MDGRDLSRSEASHGRVRNVRSSSDDWDFHRDDHYRTAEKRPGRTPRSRCGRTAIAPRSHCDRATIAPLQWRNRLQTTDDRPGLRLWVDRGAIMARSRPDRAENQAFIEAKLKLILRGIEATMPRPWNRPHVAFNRHPRPLPMATISGLISL